MCTAEPQTGQRTLAFYPPCHIDGEGDGFKRLADNDLSVPHLARPVAIQSVLRLLGDKGCNADFLEIDGHSSYLVGRWQDA